MTPSRRTELSKIALIVGVAFVLLFFAVVLGEGEARVIGLAYQMSHDITDLSTLTEHLPPYMIPSHLLRLDALPTNINGKVDRKAIRTITWTG